jgi:hypothetical protein
MRFVSFPEAVASIADDQTVFVHSGAATPAALLAALAARAPELTGVTTVGLHLEGPCPHLEPAMAGHIRHRALIVSSGNWRRGPAPGPRRGTGDVPRAPVRRGSPDARCR